MAVTTETTSLASRSRGSSIGRKAWHQEDLAGGLSSLLGMQV